jgi:hypothetical protein
MKKEDQKVIKKLNKNLSSIYSRCEVVLANHKEGNKISEKDYIWFVFSADIYYRTKDITFLNKKLKESKNNFDSSLYVLSRSVLETFIYFKYLLCEEDKIMYRLRAFICCSVKNNELKVINCLKALESKNKFIFSNDPKNILSAIMIDKKIIEFKKDVREYKTFYKEDPLFEKEVEIFEKIERVAQKYDEIKGISSIKNGSENISMEWMYNFVYRFQCMSAHQSIRDKEKVFNLFDNKEKPNNIHILGLLDDITEQILIL